MKPLTEFHRETKSPDGRQYRCRPCRKIYDVRRREPSSPRIAKVARLLANWGRPLLDDEVAA